MEPEAKNRLGWRSGSICGTLPPPHLIIAHKDRDDEVPEQKPRHIEMKLRKRGVTSKPKWIKTLNEAGIQTDVCRFTRLSLLNSITWGFMTEVERLTA